ncbi:MAG: acyl-CoA dehydrogenase family protein, partial [Lentibacter algarum]
MKPFKAPLEDILFSLRVAGAEEISDYDADFAREIGQHFAAFAEGEIAPLDEVGDVQGCRLEDGRVKMPDGFAASYQAYCAQGWPALTVPEAYGGQGMGALMLAVTSEIFSGANHSLQMVTGLVPGAVRVLKRFGTEEQRAKIMPQLAT